MNCWYINTHQKGKRTVSSNHTRKQGPRLEKVPQTTHRLVDVIDEVCYVISNNVRYERISLSFSFAKYDDSVSISSWGLCRRNPLDISWGCAPANAIGSMILGKPQTDSIVYNRKRLNSSDMLPVGWITRMRWLKISVPAFERIYNRWQSPRVV